MPPRRTPNRNKLSKKASSTDDKLLYAPPPRRSKRKHNPSTKAAASDDATCRAATERVATERAATERSGTSATTVKARPRKGVNNPLDIAYQKSDDSNDPNYSEGEEGDEDEDEDEDDDEDEDEEIVKTTHCDRQVRQKKRQDEKKNNSPPHKPQPTLAAGGVKVSALHSHATVRKKVRVKHERLLPQSSASAVSEKKGSVDSRLNNCDQALDLKTCVPISVYPFCTQTDYGDDVPATMINDVFRFRRVSSMSEYPWNARKRAHVSEGTYVFG